MLKLKKSDFDVIGRQMYNKARDVDVAIFNNMFSNDLPKNLAIIAISGYQNRDGGFAHALENDNYNANSSPYQTLEAFKLICDSGYESVGEDQFLEEMTKKAFNYLYNKCERTNGFWRATVLSNNDSVCAPWFKHNDDTLKRFGDAPTPGIIGYTLRLLDEKSPYYRKAYQFSETLIERFLNKNEFNRDEYLDYKIFINSLEKKNLYSDKLESLKEKLFSVGLEMIETNPEKFSTYCNLPLEFFDCYTGNKVIDKAIDDNLDYLINSLPNHGLWEVSFKWQNDMPEGDTALLKWMGTVTNRNLNWLKKFDRIED